MAPPFKIRKASSVERPLAAALRVMTFCTHLTSPYSRYAQALLFEDTMVDKTAVLVAVDTGPSLGSTDPASTGHVLGCADLLLLLDADVACGMGGAACYVTNVCVHPQRRRGGLGRAIMRAAEDQVCQLGGSQLVLHVYEENTPARALYQSMGYEEVREASLMSFFSSARFVEPGTPPQVLLSKRCSRRVPVEPARGVHAAERSISPVEMSISPVERSISPVEMSITPAEMSISPAERSISPPERSISPAERSISPAAARTPAARMSGAHAPEDATLDDMLRVATEAGSAAAAVVRARLGADVIKSKASRGDLLTEVDGAVQRLIEEHVLAAFPHHSFLGEESVEAGAKASAAALDASMRASPSDYLWICDPIDGTTNFVQSLPVVGISIGLARRRSDEPDGGWELVAGVIVDPFKDEVFSATLGGGARLNGEPIRCGEESLADAVVATGFAPNEASLRPMVRGIAAVGARARTVRMLGSAAIMLAWVACGRLSCYFEADLNAWDTAAGVLLIREAGGLVTDLTGEPFEIATRTLLASNRAAWAELRDVLAEADVVGLDTIA